MITEEMYEFMCMGQKLINIFIQEYPDDREGHEVFQQYVALATSLAHQALMPTANPERTVDEFNHRFAKENPECQTATRH